MFGFFLIVLAIVLLVVFWEWWKRIEGEDFDHDKRVLNVHDGSLVHTPQPIPSYVKQPGQAIAPTETAVQLTTEIASEPEPVAPPEPDDLTKIEGIGPKISQLLHNAGILTFAQLATTDVARVEEILTEAGTRYQLADPDTWPHQASLAAAGKWDELSALQEILHAGRQEAHL